MNIHVLASMLGLCFLGGALADEPLFEQDPFDQVTLDENNNSAVLKVKPLDLPDRRLPATPDPESNLVIRLVDQPDKKYEVAWKSIHKVDLFEQMVLNKANELTAAENLDEAYNYFRFLEENYARLPGRAEAHNEFLFKQAKTFFGKQQYRNALGVLRELYRRSPQRPRLDNVMGAMTEKLVEQYAVTADYASIRASCASWRPAIPITRWWRNGKRGSGTRPPRTWPMPSGSSRRAICTRLPRRSAASCCSGPRSAAPRSWPRRSTSNIRAWSSASARPRRIDRLAIAATIWNL